MKLIEIDIIEFKKEQKEFYHRINDIYVDDKLFLVAVGDVIYDKNKNIFCKSDKSIKTICKIDDKYLICGSYDGNCLLFEEVENEMKFLDTIQGPETEIKKIATDGELVAIATRGKTVWIMNTDMTLEQIIDDHQHDVKGVLFYSEQIFTWSYDNTFKIYDRGIDEWELYKSVNCGEIVWNLHIFANCIVTCLHSGEIKIYDKNSFSHKESIKLSLRPIITSCLTKNYLVLVSNLNVLVFLDREFKIIFEMSAPCYEITKIYAYENILYVGCENFLISYLIED